MQPQEDKFSKLTDEVYEIKSALIKLNEKLDKMGCQNFKHVDANKNERMGLVSYNIVYFSTNFTV